MIYEKETALKIAEYLLEIKAIKLNPTNLFTWASGIQSPIYCDNRVSLAYPVVRGYIKKSFVELIYDKFNEVEAIAGVATAGIPHGALIADEMKLPFCYVRSKPKEHGTQSLIEGKIENGQKVVVVEDLFSTGGSSIKAAKALQNEGAEVLGVIAIFSYGFQKIKEAFETENLRFYSLSNFESLVELVEKNEQFEVNDIAFMEQWYKKLA